VERAHDAWLVDLDGTLYAARPVRVAMSLELAITGWNVVSTLRRFRREHERLRALGEQAEPNPYRLQLEETARGLALELSHVEGCVQEWMFERPGKWLRQFRRTSLLRELGDFRRAGGRLALVSDYPARRKLEALGCAELFDAVVANGEEGGPRWLKPHPDGMLRAAAVLGVSPARCLVVGDRADADGEAARRAGMSFRRVG
jgi:HAD superfamily hydrolase (TIGR01549 family)